MKKFKETYCMFASCAIHVTGNDAINLIKLNYLDSKHKLLQPVLNQILQIANILFDVVYI